MKTKAIEEYVKERDKALATFDIVEFEKFVIDNVKYIGKGTVDIFVKADEDVKMGTMCKMICNVTAFDGTEAREKAVKWLTDHHMSTMI